MPMSVVLFSDPSRSSVSQYKQRNIRRNMGRKKKRRREREREEEKKKERGR